MTISKMDISEELLSQYIRNQIGTDQLIVKDWSISSLGWKASNSVTGGIYRISGTAYESAKLIHWSLILKVVIPSSEYIEPSHYNYWKREILAYESDFLNKLPSMISAPHCYAIEEKYDKSVWIWLEEVSSYIYGKWSQPQYEEVAQILGKFNGTYLVNGQIPSEPWLGRRWLSSWVEECDKYDDRTALNEESWLNGRLMQLFSPNIFQRYTEFHSRRNELLDALQRLPRVLTHNDAWSPNLFLQEDGTLIAIDWAFVGIAGVGEELGRFYGLYLHQSGLGSPKRSKSLVDVLFKKYCQGLEDVGWKGDTNLVRFGFLASAGIRCSLIFSKIYEQASKTNKIGTLVEESSIAVHLLELAEEALSLIPDLLNIAEVH